MEAVTSSGNASCHKVVWNWHSYEAQAIGRCVCVELSTKVVYDQPAYRESSLNECIQGFEFDSEPFFYNLFPRTIDKSIEM